MTPRKRPIGIIGSMDPEIEHYLKRSELKAEKKWNDFTFYEALLDGKETVIVKS